jgi:hypothetical protein
MMPACDIFAGGGAALPPQNCGAMLPGAGGSEPPVLDMWGSTVIGERINTRGTRDPRRLIEKECLYRPAEAMQLVCI